METVAVKNLGKINYESAMSAQEEEKLRVLEGKSGGCIFFLEHVPPVITLGRHCGRENILASEEVLRRRGFSILRASRGGDATVHEIGQLVAYFVLPVKAKTAAAFVQGIADTAAAALNENFATNLYYNDEAAGLWHATSAGEKKCASIGFSLSGGVSTHGMAINVCNTLEGFDFINPCGMPSQVMTTLSALIGRRVSVEEAVAVLSAAYTAAFSAK